MEVILLSLLTILVTREREKERKRDSWAANQDLQTLTVTIGKVARLLVGVSGSVKALQR